jgi:hypothetical protein
MPLQARSMSCTSQAHGPCQYVHTSSPRTQQLTRYYPFIKSTKNIISAAEKSGTVKRVVFTQAGAGLIDSEVGDTYGNQMQEILNGRRLTLML